MVLVIIFSFFSFIIDCKILISVINICIFLNFLSFVVYFVKFYHISFKYLFVYIPFIYLTFFLLFSIYYFYFKYFSNLFVFCYIVLYIILLKFAEIFFSGHFLNYIVDFFLQLIIFPLQSVFYLRGVKIQKSISYHSFIP